MTETSQDKRERIYKMLWKRTMNGAGPATMKKCESKKKNKKGQKKDKNHLNEESINIKLMNLKSLPLPPEIKEVKRKESNI